MHFKRRESYILKPVTTYLTSHTLSIFLGSSHLVQRKSAFDDISWPNIVALAVGKDGWTLKHTLKINCTCRTMTDQKHIHTLATWACTCLKYERCVIENGTIL